MEHQHSFLQRDGRSKRHQRNSIGRLYLILVVIVLLGSTNAVNLTDGLDGLAISVTFIAMSALTAFTYIASDAVWAAYLDLTHRPQAAELTVFCGAMAGASLGFLWFNAPPAEVFMGDVGSLAIGGAMGTIAVLTKQEFMLLMVGGVFVLEAMSVMLQVAVFKMTKRTSGVGRRVFKMTPLHHHFEMVGWKEPKIVFRFLILAILFALLSLSTLKLVIHDSVRSCQVRKVSSWNLRNLRTSKLVNS